MTFILFLFHHTYSNQAAELQGELTMVKNQLKKAKEEVDSFLQTNAELVTRRGKAMEEALAREESRVRELPVPT